MSFRGRLFIFFTIIVIVPMAAVAVVLFRITSDSETGKSDSRIAQGLTTGLAGYQADIDRAGGAPRKAQGRDLKTNGGGARGRSHSVRGPPLPPVSVGVLDRVDSSAVHAGRALIGGILLAFLILALASSILVVRALQGQVAQ